MKTTGIYCRVSTSAQKENGTSLDTQLAACQHYATSNGYTVLKAIQEDASGALLSRAGLDEIRDMVRDGQLQAVIVYDTDRLSRNLAHLMLQEEFEQKRVELHFVNAPTEDTPEGQMLFGMKGLFAQYERTKIMERSRRGKEKCARDGRILGGWLAPFGYRYIAGEGRYEVNEEEAIIVQQMFQWVGVEGMSTHMVARKLGEMGVPTQHNARWWPTTVRGILQNEVYYGQAFWGRREQVYPKTPKNGGTRHPRKSSWKMRDPSAWIAIPCPAIVTKELWDKAQASMQHNKKMALRNCKREYLLRGRLKCALCGYSMTGTAPHDTPRYRCGGRDANLLAGGGKTQCSGKMPLTQEVESQVWDWVMERLNNPHLIRQMVDDLEDDYGKAMEKYDNELSTLTSVEQKIDGEEDKLIELYTAGAITFPKFTERKAILDHKREGITTAKSDLSYKLALHEQAMAQKETIEELVSILEEGLPLLTTHTSYAEKLRVLDALKITVVYQPDGTVDVSGIISDALCDLTSTAHVRTTEDILRMEDEHPPAHSARTRRNEG